MVSDAPTSIRTVDQSGRNSAYSTRPNIGRRKTSTAKVDIYYNANRTGSMYFNSRHVSLYLQGNFHFRKILEAPFLALGINGFYDVLVKVRGGGLRGQTEAAALGISRCLSLISLKLRSPSSSLTELLAKRVQQNPSTILKKGGYLTRDPRAKERKKYGLRKARKAPQFSKR
jgi:small subunit ribosomal protein S9